MKELIERQNIIIDNHRRGTGQPNDWDDSSAEIHLDKRTNWKHKGKFGQATIKIPINSDKEPYYEFNDKQDDSFKRKINKEINKALIDKKKRTLFVKEMIDRIKNFESDLANREKAQSAVRRIARAFDLNEKIIREIVTYVDDNILTFTTLHSDSENKIYFIRLDRYTLSAGEVSNRFIVSF